MADMIVEKENNSAGPIAVVVTIFVLLLLGYFAWQYFGGMDTTDTTNTTDVNITAPADDTSAPAEDTQTPTTEETPAPTPTTQEPTPDTTQE